MSYYSQYSTEIKQAISLTKDINLFPELSIPKSTAREWIKKEYTEIIAPTSINLAHQKKLERLVEKQKMEIKNLQSKLELLNSIQSLLKQSLPEKRIRDNNIKKSILEIIDNFKNIFSIKEILKTVKLKRDRYQRWKRDVQKSESKITKYKQEHPQALTKEEFMILKSIHKNPKYAHYPSASLHHLAKRKDLLHCSESTWLKYVKEQDLKRPYKRHNLRDYKVGVRAEDINEIWHIDITVIKLSHGKSLYLQTIIDNYSRMCLAWQLNKSKEALNTVELLEKAREFKAKETSLFMDQGSENINEKVSFFLEKNKITRIIAKHDTKYSNSMVEVFFRSLKNNYLYFQNPKSFNDLNKKLLFYIREYNHNIPHRAHNGFTPYEIFSKTPKDELLKQFKEGMIKSFNFRKESYYNLNWA